MRKIIISLVIFLTVAFMTASAPRLLSYWQSLSSDSNKPGTSPGTVTDRNQGNQDNQNDPGVDKGSPKPDSGTPKPDPDIPKPNPDTPKPNPDTPKPDPDTPKPDPVNNTGEQDKTAYSWWFTRNNQHRPPAFNTKAAATVKGKGYYLGQTTGKKVYLTFDEGYENGYTPEILDILKANSVPAAFFVTGDYVNKNPELVKRMAAEGHIIGNHTATHPSLPGLTDNDIRKELQLVHDKYSFQTLDSLM